MTFCRLFMRSCVAWRLLAWRMKTPAKLWRLRHSFHICNEIEEPYKGSVRRRWEERSENTHWLDASYYTNVGANIKGIKPLKPKAGPAPTTKPRRKVAYL